MPEDPKINNFFELKVSEDEGFVAEEQRSGLQFECDVKTLRFLFLLFSSFALKKVFNS